MPYNYTGYVAALAGLLVVPSTDADFQAMLPNFIDAAEGGILRDLDILDMTVRDTSGFLTANSRTFNLPQTFGPINILQSINVITPAGSAVTSGTRNQLVPVSRDYLDVIWPTEVAPFIGSVPDKFATVTSQQIIVGPSPSAPYQMEVIGQARLESLSASNPNTLLTENLPDVFLLASMKFGAGYLKNFGAGADDPRSGLSWSAAYDRALQSEQVQEFRRKFAASAWSSITPSPLAQPPRN